MPIIPKSASHQQRTRRLSRMLAVLLLLLGGPQTNSVRSNELFSPPPSSSSNRDLRPLPPVCDAPPCLLDCRRNALFPNSVQSPLESSLFCSQLINRPLIGQPLLPPPPRCLPTLVPGPISPGFTRSLGRYGLVSPVPPAVVSAHAPPWEQLSALADLKGQVAQVPFFTNCFCML